MFLKKLIVKKVADDNKIMKNYPTSIESNHVYRHVISTCIFAIGRPNCCIYEGHPINRENFLIMQEFVPLEHGKCNH